MFYACNTFAFDMVQAAGQRRKPGLSQTAVNSYRLTLRSWCNTVVGSNLPHLRLLVLALANDGCKYGGKRSVMALKIEFGAEGVKVEHECGTGWFACGVCAEKRVAVKEVEAVCKKSRRGASEDGAPRLSGSLLDALLALCGNTKW